MDVAGEATSAATGILGRGGARPPPLPEVPMAGVAVRVEAVAPVSGWVAPVSVSPLALLAGYAGLVAFLVVPAPIAVALGWVALRDLRKHPGKTGRGRAIFALLVGVPLSVVLVVGVVAVAFGVVGK